MWQSLTGSSPVDDARRSVSPKLAKEPESHRSSPDTSGVASFFENLRADNEPKEMELSSPPSNSRRKSMPPPPPRRVTQPTVPNSDSEDDLDYFRTGDASPVRSRKQGNDNSAPRSTTSPTTAKFAKRVKANKKVSGASKQSQPRKSSGFQLPLKPDIADDPEEPRDTRVETTAPNTSVDTKPPESGRVPTAVTKVKVTKKQPSELSDVEFSSDEDDDLGETGGGENPRLTLGTSSLRAEAAKTLNKIESKTSSWTPQKSNEMRLSGSDWRPSPKSQRKESNASEHYHFGSRQGSDDSQASEASMDILSRVPEVSEPSTPVPSAVPFPAVVPSAEGTIERTTVLVPRSTGLGLQLVTADGTTWISRIGKGSPAEECGQLHEGDVLISINEVRSWCLLLPLMYRLY